MTMLYKLSWRRTFGDR